MPRTLPSLPGITTFPCVSAMCKMQVGDMWYLCGLFSCLKKQLLPHFAEKVTEVLRDRFHEQRTSVCAESPTALAFPLLDRIPATLPWPRPMGERHRYLTPVAGQVMSSW